MLEMPLELVAVWLPILPILTHPLLLLSPRRPTSGPARRRCPERRHRHELPYEIVSTRPTALRQQRSDRQSDIWPQASCPPRTWRPIRAPRFRRPPGQVVRTHAPDPLSQWPRSPTATPAPPLHGGGGRSRSRRVRARRVESKIVEWPAPWIDVLLGARDALVDAPAALRRSGPWSQGVMMSSSPPMTSAGDVILGEPRRGGPCRTSPGTRR